MTFILDYLPPQFFDPYPLNSATFPTRVPRCSLQLETSPATKTSNHGRLLYSEGFPRPEPSEPIIAVPRHSCRKNIAAKERKAGRVPGILFQQQASKSKGFSRLISLHLRQVEKLIRRNGIPFLCSKLFELEVRQDFESDEVIERVRVLPREIQMHPKKKRLVNATFIRAFSDCSFRINVPVVYVGEEESPGLYKGDKLNMIRETVEIVCSADIMPPYVELDISNLDTDETAFVKDIKFPPTVTVITPLGKPVCSVYDPKR